MDNIRLLDNDSLCYIFDDASPAYENAYLLAENESRSYVFMCTPGTRAKNIDLCFVLDRNASVRVELLVAHTDAHITIRCIMRGESSQAAVNGAYVLRGANHARINTEQRHEAAYSSSTFVVKGVVDESAQVFYSGMIHVEKAARCSVSSQENKNMLLSKCARAVSIPSLEVLTNDVQCFHGSASSTLDQEYLFYAAARGIDKNQMRRLLVHAFFVGLFEDKHINDLLGGLL